VSFLKPWRRMERREAFGEWVGIAGVFLLTIGGYLAWSFESLGIVVGVAIALCFIGAMIMPPTWWRWGKRPAPIQDPSHERKA